MVRRLAPLAALLLSTTALAQDIPNHAIPIGRGPGAVGFAYAGPCGSNQVLIWQNSVSDPICATAGGGGGGGISTLVTAPPINGNITGSQLNIGITLGQNFVNNVSNQLSIKPIASGQLIANSTAGLLEPSNTTLTAFIDTAISSTAGAMLVRGSTTWAGVLMTGDGTLSPIGALTIANKAITYAKFQDVANHRILGRNSAGSGVVEEVTPAQTLDWINNVQGSILYRSVGGWIALGPGTAGQVLTSGGPAAEVTWAAGGGGGGGLTCPTLNLTGDVTTSNSCNTVLATVNSAPGAYGSPATTNTITVNAKGLVTSITATAISIPFTTVTGSLGCLQLPPFSGDVTNAGGTCGTTISNNVVTNAKLAQMPAATLKGNPSAASANAVDFTIQGLPNKSAPDPANDKLLLFDNSTGLLKYCTLNQCGVGGGGGGAGVSSLNLLTGAVVVSPAAGITVTPSGQNIQIGLAAVTNPTTTLLTTGSGTYTTPTGAVRLEVTMVGSGGGGQGGGSSPGDGTNAAATTFGPATSGGGLNGGASVGAGGTGTGCTQSSQGGMGDGGSLSLSGQFNGKGGAGGGSFFGGGSRGNYNTGGAAGGAIGSGGSGGSAGSAATALGGGGGGAGAYCFTNYRTPAASYSWSIGAVGTGGAAGSGGGTAGGNGVAGVIFVKEYYSAGGGSGGGGGSAGVSSLNTLLGDLNIAPGTGINVTQAGSTITITNTASTDTTSFTTGDMKPTMKTVADAGWLMLYDGATIGDTGSSGTVMQSPAAQALFGLLWSTCPTYCAVHPSRGGDAASDWAAKKTIDLPISVGRAVGVAGAASGLTNRPLGLYRGTEQVLLPNYNLSVSGAHTLSVSEMPAHTHTTDWATPWQIMWYFNGAPTNPYGNLNLAPGDGNASMSTTAGGGGAIVGYSGSSAAFSMTSTGTGTPQAGLVMFEPMVYWNWMIKL